MLNVKTSIARLTPILALLPLSASSQILAQTENEALATVVSPGHPAETALIGQSCPTFSWGAALNAQRYELAIFDAQWNPSTDPGEQDLSGRLLQQIAIDAPATSWTPSGPSCLTPGAAYVWFVRPVTEDGPQSWSSGARFEIDLDVDSIAQAVRRELAAQLQQPEVWREAMRQGFAVSNAITSISSAGTSTTAQQSGTAWSASEDGIDRLRAQEKELSQGKRQPRAGAESYPNPSALKTSGPNGVVFGGALFDGGIPAEGAGVRFMWYPTAGVIRAGTVTADQWDSGNVGVFSTAMGYNPIASGGNSTAFGVNTTASGVGSTALGTNTVASGSDSTAIGGFTNATGSRSTAMGSGTTASGDFSTAMGQGTIAPSGYEIAIGRYNESYNPFSTSGWNGDDHLFVIGNGTADDNRSNAFVVEKSGRVGIGVDFANWQLHLSEDSAAKPGGGSWSTTSDARLKDVTGQYVQGLDAILALEPVRFHYKPGNARQHDPTPEYVGFIAQQVKEVVPEAVTEAEDGYLDFNMHAVNVALVNAVKEQQTQIDALKSELEAVKAQNAVLAAVSERLNAIEMVIGHDATVIPAGEDRQLAAQPR
ncbi:MAG: tail fiber domain-containing protein [Chromatiaceae bacterium]|nr:tail fiber domain-containing protein [Chromatiaceae bacterium]MCF7993326.1 tail fiber domain-containing protein [Chromatiaceae bacterium]MCF8017509.1 tail fiber domain-containing protein [Chromatiaceae bacterium]